MCDLQATNQAMKPIATQDTEYTAACPEKPGIIKRSTLQDVHTDRDIEA